MTNDQRFKRTKSGREEYERMSVSFDCAVDGNCVATDDQLCMY